MIVKRGLPMLGGALKRLNKAQFAMALDICVPPLASLVAALFGASIAFAVWALAGGSSVPALLAVTGLGIVTVSVLSAWHRYARHVISGQELMSVPGYIVRKLPLYWDAIRGRRAAWQRARRDRD